MCVQSIDWAVSNARRVQPGAMICAGGSNLGGSAMYARTCVSNSDICLGVSSPGLIRISYAAKCVKWAA